MHMIPNGSTYWITRSKYLAWLYLNSHILKLWMANQKSDASDLTQYVNITVPIPPVECPFKIPAVSAKTILFLTLCYSQVTWCFQNMSEVKFLLYLVKIIRTKAYRQLWMETTCDLQGKRWHQMVHESVLILTEYSAAKACNETLPMISVNGQDQVYESLCMRKKI